MNPTTEDRGFEERNLPKQKIHPKSDFWISSSTFIIVVFLLFVFNLYTLIQIDFMFVFWLFLRLFLYRDFVFYRFFFDCLDFSEEPSNITEATKTAKINI